MKPIFNAISIEKYNWDDKCTKSMASIKNLLLSDLVLAHYDPTLPIILICDASQYGIGMCIVHCPKISGRKRKTDRIFISNIK